MNATRATVAALAVLLTASPAIAADVPAGAASCSGCHGHVAEGNVGPGLNDNYWTYPKNKTDKGLFETIFGGAQGIFHLAQVADQLGGPTILVNVPTMMAQMLNHPDAASQDLSCLRYCT